MNNPREYENPSLESDLSDQNNKKKTLSLVISVLISIGILWYLAKSLDWERVISTLKEVSIFWLVIWVLLFLTVTYLRTIRWNHLFAPDQQTSFMLRFDALNIGNLASMILPLRAGEFLRPLFFSKWTGFAFGKVFASVVIERVFDVCGMFLIFFIFVSGIPDIPATIYAGSKALGIIASGIIVAVFFAYFAPDLIQNILKKTSEKTKILLPSSIVDCILKLGLEFIDGLGSIASFRQLFTLLVFTAFIWFLYASSFMVLVFALQESSGAIQGYSSDFYSMLSIGAVCCVFVGLFIAAPSAPGFFGTFHLGCVAALNGVFAFSEEFSFAYAILAHAIQVLCTIAIGCLSLSFRGINLSSLAKT
ncbi:MAG TPA: lysylphosphatidylglycerol synthase transmembrane domain-containing protein [Oligoflexia bacterium]|nr:lysylphosphatidylglycerol synthase transmembrane domain-containing protein [Oligoflexia bacterium]HMP47985.1 lysylphosphatidylglycerol synthase transmembrane domain-containing protein [Oligoflexia bacterium]